MVTCSCCGELKEEKDISRTEKSRDGLPMCQRCVNQAWDDFLDERARRREEREAAARAAESSPQSRKPKLRPEVAPPPASRKQPRKTSVSSKTRDGSARAVAARENGRRGGRPPKWKPEVRKEAGQLLRSAILAGMLEGRGAGFKDELLRLAKALEEGRIR